MVSGSANSGGYSCGTGSIRHDELLESEFLMTPGNALVSVSE